jgi:FkbM family methyltransferase
VRNPDSPFNQTRRKSLAARSQPDIVHAHIGVFMGIQRLVYASKSLRGSPLVRPLNTMGKKAAGLYFDVFLGRYRTEGMTFEIPKEHTDLAMRGKFTADTYELPERVLAKHYLPPTAAVLELGGCIGVVACVINHVLQQPRRHVVVEGNPSIIPVLKRNRDLNGCAFQIVHGVVTQSPQPRMSVGLVMDSNQVANTGVEVPALSIEYLESTYAMRFDALVMDIEGAEYNVLRENANHLPSLNTAIIEFHPWLIGEARTAQLYRLMSEAGLRKVDEMLSTQVWLRA